MAKAELGPAVAWIGLARRAGKLAPGDQAVHLALKYHRARLVWLAEDGGQATRRKYEFWAKTEGVPVVRAGTKVELGSAAGMAPLAVLAIEDRRMAERVLDALEVAMGGLEFGREGQNPRIRTGQRVEVGQPAPDRPAAPTARGKHQKSHEHRGTGGGADGSGHHARQAATRPQASRSASPTGASARARSRGSSGGATAPRPHTRPGVRAGRGETASGGSQAGRASRGPQKQRRAAGGHSDRKRPR